MPNNTLSAQDEARRKLAERLEFGLRANCTHYALRIEECEMVVAALRAEPARAEEMRERAAKVCDEEARDQHDFWLRAVGDGDEVGIHMADAAEEAAKELAAAIRALPASQPNQGGEDE